MSMHCCHGANLAHYRSLGPSAVLALLLIGSTLLVGCTAGTKETSNGGTFRTGEKVQVGPLQYTVIEAGWRNHLAESIAADVPKHRYLFLRMNLSNLSDKAVEAPSLTLENASGESFPEVTEGTGELENWLGVFRRLGAGESKEGFLVFDVPMAAYKLRITEPGDQPEGKFALVEITVPLE